MQDHNIPLSLFIISVYILTVLVLWNIFSKGHITVMSCLFLRYDPSTLPKKSLKGGKSTNASLQIWDFLPFYQFSKWHALTISTKLILKGLFRKYFICSISFKQLLGQISCHCILIFVHCQVQSLCWSLCGEVISILNLRTMCLWCILWPTSFQFFENFQKQRWWKA